jgi:lysine 6-dehydrogenase
VSYVYAVLGSGRQGTASAYDMARFGDAKQVLLVDCDLGAAEDSAARINRLLDSSVTQARRVDVTDPEQLVAVLRDVDAFVSAVPYWHNPRITTAAIRARACMTDLGGNTELVRKQLLQSPEAEKAGVAVIPDCGQVPGMGTSLITYCMSKLDRTDEVMMWDGGNAAEPRPPFNYILTFNIAGLTNEYYGVAHFIREGRRVEVPTFLPEDYETIELPDPIGEMEAFVAGGGTSTMPWSFEGKLVTLWNKTLRWPGHFAQWKAYMDAGLLEERAIDVDGLRVSPRQVLHTLLEPKIKASPEERDFVVVRVVAKGTKDGKPCQVLTELTDRYDPDTGFTAMERTTGWDAAIKAIMTVRGETPRGVHPAEIAVPPALYVEELRRRGFALRESFSAR